MADFTSRHGLCAWHSVSLGTPGWESMVGSLHSSVHWLHLESVLDKTANGQVAQEPTFMSLVPGLQAAIPQKYCPRLTGPLAFYMYTLRTHTCISTHTINACGNSVRLTNDIGVTDVNTGRVAQCVSGEHYGHGLLWVLTG